MTTFAKRAYRCIASACQYAYVWVFAPLACNKKRVETSLLLYMLHELASRFSFDYDCIVVTINRPQATHVHTL